MLWKRPDFTSFHSAKICSSLSLFHPAALDFFFLCTTHTLYLLTFMHLPCQRISIEISHCFFSSQSMLLARYNKSCCLYVHGGPLKHQFVINHESYSFLSFSSKCTVWDFWTLKPILINTTTKAKTNLSQVERRVNKIKLCSYSWVIYRAWDTRGVLYTCLHSITAQNKNGRHN